MDKQSKFDQAFMLFKNESQTGKTYYSTNLDGVDYVGFPTKKGHISFTKSDSTRKRKTEFKLKA